MAFFRSEIYRKLGDVEMQRYWLIQSALADIRNAIMDQGSLWSLANSLISKKEDVNRAHRYIDFSWKCLTRFSTHMRSWQVAPVVARINDEYKQQLQTANNHLRWTIGIISLLLLGLLFSLLYVMKKRRQLAKARNELNSLNDQLEVKNQQLLENNTLLSDANQMLSDTNEQLRNAIMHLNDTTRVKDEYIGKFLTICSDYINKLDNYRIKVNRKLKANQYNDLLRMTSSEHLKEDELKELLENFDSVFLHLFPTFIDDFNALLRKEERIIPTDRNSLNTDLRIFALIRLGIDESSKIAEFLHYSPNSIYAYRARIKNKAAGNRDNFEQMVKEIGMQQ
ncbi:MAG: transcriptional regulator [Prevotella sp.]|nr:transcriptional regulator [Prevotella sp.]